jgi:glycosyltransferase involved in cell wall biosynthesis
MVLRYSNGLIMSELAIVVPAYNEQGITDTLDALYHQYHRSGVMHYIVNNASTDDMVERITSFVREHDDFPLTVVDEPQKGTGSACDTGFRRAIDDGYPVIARTDADSLPRDDWTLKIMNHFRSRPTLQLLGGKSVGLRDQYYRTGDDVRRVIGINTSMSFKALMNADPGYFKHVFGHNLAARSGAYIESGGFPRTTIRECDEDVEFTLRVYDKFGWRAIDTDRELRVATSQRRARQLGFVAGTKYYLFPNRRDELQVIEDIR